MICRDTIDENTVNNVRCIRYSINYHYRCFRNNTISFRSLKQELKCPVCRLFWEPTPNSPFLSECEHMNGSKIDAIDVDDSSPELDEQLFFGIASLKTFHCNICRIFSVNIIR